KHLFLLVVGLLLLTCAAWAQINDRGVITGIVMDPSGLVVPDVAITVTNSGTGVANNVTTNASGVYMIPNLPPAVYRLTAEKTGFKRYARTSVLVQIGATTRLDFALTLGSKTEVVEVTSTAPLLQRESAETS